MARAKTRPAIAAFHQVGNDDWSSEERVETLDLILSRGRILPAIGRVKRAEMHEECFGDSYTDPIRSRWKNASPLVIHALEDVAREWLDRLPVHGTTHTLFNCVDLLAGELERIFLNPLDWYGGLENGFIFDAEGLIERGARFRRDDLLGSFSHAVQEIADLDYRSEAEARDAIRAVLDDVREDLELRGREAVRELRACVAALASGESDRCSSYAEVVWTGPLSVSLAVEVWREGDRIK